MHYLKEAPPINILVFKTNVTNNSQASKLVNVLEKMDGILNWNLDLEDWENILKIEFSELKTETLYRQLSEFDIEIEELIIW